MTSHPQDTSWFLAQLKPNASAIAERNLQRQGFRTFLPVGEETRPRNGKFVTTTQPLFPGYIFVAVDVARGLWRKVNATHGITRLVSFGKTPAAVPRDLVSQLMARCDTAGKLLPPGPPKPGDRVTFARGPFANFVAEVEKVAPDQRVWVLMEFMGGQTRVAIRPEQLRAS